jgi:hypothetical protein
MEVGSRVVFITGKKLILGTIVKSINQNFMVSFDKDPFHRDKFVEIPPNMLVPVNYWISKPIKDISEVKPTEKTPLEQFLQKGTKRFDIIAGRGMWAWVNLHLYDSGLTKLPVLTSKLSDLGPDIQKKFKRTTGLCALLKKGLFIYINMKSTINMYSMWNTLVHETVHQYCFQHNEDDAHGPNFRRWSAAIKSVCKVTLDVTHDAKYDTYDINDSDSASLDETQDYYILLIKNESTYVGIGADSLSIIQKIKSDIGMNYLTYIRKSNSLQIKNYLNVVKTDRITINRKTKILPTQLAQQLIEDDKYKLYSKMVALC